MIDQSKSLRKIHHGVLALQLFSQLDYILAFYSEDSISKLMK